ncbi:hypothetical protein B7P43_G10249 [Cryptotermes secundus]|uniref:Uncharacterized protein n=1 Tax=Cryptotermes secundus TaxID=105785 RepID=A0A2J7PED9_9NEOP|nr:hypothetical protein B7P43_G10249 [Cryptotermes secundus]
MENWGHIYPDKYDILRITDFLDLSIIWYCKEHNFSPEDGNIPFPKTGSFRITNDGQSPKSQ